MRIGNKDIRTRRKIRIRSKIQGTKEKPRISIFRSNRYIYAQAIDDDKRRTLAAASSLDSKKKTNKIKKKDEAKNVGEKLAMILLKKGIKKGVFDRGVYSYEGRVKALAEGLRKGGFKI